MQDTIRQWHEANAVVFDFDGVLADSEPCHYAALRAAMDAVGLDLTHEDYVASFIGRPDSVAYEIVAQRLSRPGDATLVANLARVRDAEYLSLCKLGRVRLFDGAARVVREAADHKRVALCSGSLRDEVEAVLNANDLLSIFNVRVMREDYSNPKPSPEPYAVAATRMGIAPSLCVALEDTPIGELTHLRWSR